MLSLLASQSDVSVAVRLLFAGLLVGLIVCLALEEKLHAKKSVIAGIFAIVCLLAGSACQILPFAPVVVGSTEIVEQADVPAESEVDDPAEHTKTHLGGHEIKMPVYIPGIDWGVIAIILGSSLFVDVTSRSGLFTWIAIKVTKASGGDPLKLLYCYGIMTVVFSAVLNNVTAMIIVGSLTVVSLDKLELRDKLMGFLLIEGLLTNVGGLLTLISSVPNIIVGTAAGISFVEFFVKASPYVLVATILTLWMGARLFAIRSIKDAEAKLLAKEQVAGFDETDGIESWGFFWFSAVMLLLFICTIATTSALPFISDLEMGYVALSFAGIMLVRFKSEADQFYKAIDWDLIAFFMSLFVVIYVMEHAQVLTEIGNGMQLVLNQITAPVAGITDASMLLIGAAGFSSVTDNIPLAAMLSNILSDLGTPSESGLWWSVIFGANLGGNLTPIGSASTLVAVTVMHKHKIPISFAGFVKIALPYALIQIGLATVYVVIFLR
jgi:Na+/H+ antiporter NhaD/arsenite permease-like protein